MCQEQWGPNIPGLRSSLESRAHLLICPAGSGSHRHTPLPGTWSPGAPTLLPLPFLCSSQDVPLRNVFQQRLTTVISALEGHCLFYETSAGAASFPPTSPPRLHG